MLNGSNWTGLAQVIRGLNDLLNALHPRTGHEWATNVSQQLGKHGRLLTYEGWGHGSYQRTPCTISAVDRYLIDLVAPAAPPHKRALRACPGHQM
ncbi:alpha/beta hydrolase [Micromonospora sp. CA-111912]|uniref:alpha/beta hydrolase n=1 Tax=Micromonospora sp. CA-111912 TaxID=3239955 RepID=UPI003D906C84